MKSLSNHLCELLATTRADWRLDVIRSRSSVDTIAPDVRAQLGESESLIVRDDAQTEGWARLALADRAVVEIVRLRIHSFGECLALGRLGDKEVGAQVHGYTVMVEELITIVDHYGLSVQTFLDVYQKDQNRYACRI